MTIIIRVFGTPGPQGSKRFMGVSKAGKGILVESSSKVKVWRESVKAAAWEVLNARLCDLDAIPVVERGLLRKTGGMSGPIHLEVTFTMARPKSAKKGAVPSTRPDLSKLIRSTEDALTDVGAYEDDARIVECLARKVFPGQHSDALEVPGAVIRIKGKVA